MNKIILPVMFIVLSIGLFVGFVDPTYKEIKELKVVDKQYDEARNKSKELRIIRDKLLKKYNSFSDDGLDRIKKMLPDNVDNVRLVMDINSIASNYGAVIRDIKLDELANDSDKRPRINAEEKDYGSVNLSFSIITNYANFVSFIGDIKDSLRLVEISSLGFVPIAGEDDLYKFNFTIKTYWLK